MIETAQFNDRTRKSFWKKINPIWWFQNDDNQTIDSAPWYHPVWPRWRRWLTWNVLRNPMQNFRAFVVGVQDKNYTVRGRYPVLTVQRDDLQPPEFGWQWCVLYGGDLYLPRAFCSYCSGAFVFYLGWQPNGFFGMKINL